MLNLFQHQGKDYVCLDPETKFRMIASGCEANRRHAEFISAYGKDYVYQILKQVQDDSLRG